VETRWIASVGRKRLKFPAYAGFNAIDAKVGVSNDALLQDRQISLGFVCIRLPVRHAGTFYGTKTLMPFL